MVSLVTVKHQFIVFFSVPFVIIKGYIYLFVIIREERSSLDEMLDSESDIFLKRFFQYEIV